MWQYNPTNEFMHYGKIGMKWGKRRAIKAATKAGRAKASAVEIDNRGNQAAKELNDRARSLGNKSKNAKGAASSTYFEARSGINKLGAQSVKTDAKYYSDHYAKIAATKTMKANKLAKKYGDAETIKKVNDVIKANSNKPYAGLPTFSSHDPLAVALSSAASTAAAAAITKHV